MNESRPQLFGMLAGLFLAAGLVLSAMLGTSAWMKIKNSQFITVKGSVQKKIESDLAIWSGSFQVEAETLLDAQHKIQANRALVAKFLDAAGVANLNFAPINIQGLQFLDVDGIEGHAKGAGWICGAAHDGFPAVAVRFCGIQ